MTDEEEPRRVFLQPLLVLAALLGVGGAWLALPLSDYWTALLSVLRAWGGWGLAALGVLYVIACVLLVPGSVITLGAGFLAATLWPASALAAVAVATAMVSVSSVAGATAAFVLGRTIARDWVTQRLAGKSRFQALDRAVGDGGFRIVFLLRLSPVFPFNVLNYALGLTRVRLRDYVLASWIGMLPGTVLYVYLGTGLQNLAAVAAGQVEAGLGSTLLFGAGLLATAFLVVVSARLAQKALRVAGTNEAIDG